LEAAAARELAGLIGGLRPDDCARIAGLAKDELSLLHFGLGLYVRNQIYDNKLPALGALVGSEELLGGRDPDIQSMRILELIWEKLRADQPPASDPP